MARRVLRHGEQFGSILRIAAAPSDQEWMQHDWRTADDYGSFLSSSRPPMSSDLPHPSKVNLSTPARRRAEASEDPNNDPYGWLNGTGISFEDLVANHMSHHQNMDDDQRFKGRVWYRAAHDQTGDVARKTLGDHDRAVAVMSAYSPVKDWDANLEQGIHFLTHYDGSDPDFRMPMAPKDQTANAVKIYNAPAGSDYSAILGGPKTRSFFRNILDKTPLRSAREGRDDDDGFYELAINPYTGEPDWRMHPDQDVTVDTHHARLQNTPHGADLSDIKYDTPPYFNRKLKIDGKDYHPGYDLHARASAEATRRLNLAEPDVMRHLIPKQTQAGPWGKFKADLINAGVSSRMPEPGQKPRGKLGPLSNPIPRYQRDIDSQWWNDDRRPEVDLRSTPNWNRHLGSIDLPTWDSMLDDWIGRTYPHRVPVLKQAYSALYGAQKILRSL